tara:strand:+ start:2566 stop:3750 length:1185 start_codon:yes stop_codon:yes gene_type:complete
MEIGKSEQELEVIIEDDAPGAKVRFNNYLKEYNKLDISRSVWQRRRENTPFSILIEDDSGLKDIDEIWIGSHGLIYLSRLLDNNQDMINLIYERTPRGIQGFRYAVQFLFLYNISRIHKIVERDSSGHPTFYEEEPNTIFQNINSGNIIYNNYANLTENDKILINIMHEEVSLLIPDNMQDANDIHPFDGRSVLDDQTGLFFKIFKSQFHLFVNRVSLKYYKTMRLNKKASIKNSSKGGGDFTNSTISSFDSKKSSSISYSNSKKSNKTDSNSLSVKVYISKNEPTCIKITHFSPYQSEYLNKVKIFKEYILQASINLPPDVKTLNSSRSSRKNTKLSNLIKKTPKNPKYGESMENMSDGYIIINNSYTKNGAEIGKDIILTKGGLKKGGLKKK